MGDFGYRFWDCSVLGCPLAAAVDAGGCERCQSHFCAEHVESAYHTCDSDFLDDEAWLAAQTRELTALRDKTNEAALLQRVRQLSGRRQCHLDENDPVGRSLMGGMHVHRQIFFNDGTVWLVRILRENYTSFGDQLSNDILLSECATLRWLEAIDIPTPKLHGYGLRGDPNNAVGVAYMLMDKVPGKPFVSELASQEQKRKVWDQWAEVLRTLEKHPFTKLGSLTFEGVGPVACDRTGTLPPIGPFNTARDMYSAWTQSYLDLIADRQLFSSFSVDAYLIFDHLLSSVRDGQWLTKWEHLNEGPFFLKHTDDKGDHILVDEDFNITGIIDWTFARIVPPYEAFGPSLISADNNLLFDGKVGLSVDDQALGQLLKLKGLTHVFFDSDEMRRFFLGPGIGLGPTNEEAIALFNAIIGTFETNSHEWNWRQWKAARLRELSKNPQLSALIQRQAPHSIPRFATCSTSNCERPSVRGRSCQACESHLCATHILSQHHRCSSLNEVDEGTWEASIRSEVESLLARVNVPKLVELASSLRQEIPCTFRPGKYLGQGAIMGCANYHAELVFNDGARWLVRIPRTTSFSDIPSDLVEYLVKSEYATLKWLERVSAPTPKAYAYGLDSDPENLVGVSFLLEEALPGRPFYPQEASGEHKSRVYKQYARFLLDVRRHPATQACSLVPSSDGITEGPVASNRFLNLAMYGPFKTPQEYYSSVADMHIQLISDGQIYPKYPKEAYIFYRLLKEQAVSALADTPSPALSGFFLKHVDDKGDHILVDEEYNITGIIDWQFARFVPACEAFGPSLFTADLSTLYDGTVGLSSDDRLLAAYLADQEGDGSGLGELANGNELARRFQFGLASGLARDEVLGLIKAVLSILDHDLPTVDPPEATEPWVEAQWAQAAGEPWFEATKVLVEELERLKGQQPQ